MSQVRVRLKQFLDKHHITTYRLAESTSGTSPKTIYAVASGTRKPSIETLGSVVEALRQLTGESVTFDDLLEFTPSPDPETATWLEADLGGPLPDYDWGAEGPPKGKPIRYEPGKGFLVQGGKGGD